MKVALLLALQTAGSAEPPKIAPGGFDLAKYRPSADPRGCGAQGSEIVVCGRRGGNDYPLEEMERRFREKPLRAEIGIGGGTTLRAYGDSAEMPGGQISKRAMVGIKVPF